MVAQCVLIIFSFHLGRVHLLKLESAISFLSFSPSLNKVHVCGQVHRYAHTIDILMALNFEKHAENSYEESFANSSFRRR